MEKSTSETAIERGGGHLDLSELPSKAPQDDGQPSKPEQTKKREGAEQNPAIMATEVEQTLVKFDHPALNKTNADAPSEALGLSVEAVNATAPASQTEQPQSQVEQPVQTQPAGPGAASPMISPFSNVAADQPQEEAQPGSMDPSDTMHMDQSGSGPGETSARNSSLPAGHGDATANADLTTSGSKQHHLLKHLLTEEKRGENALQHFGTSDPAEAVALINAMVQRQLQIHFAKVYGVRSNSNNNTWLRKKLLEAVAPKHMWEETLTRKDSRGLGNRGDTVDVIGSGGKRAAGQPYTGSRSKRPAAAAGVAVVTAAELANSKLESMDHVTRYLEGNTSQGTRYGEGAQHHGMSGPGAHASAYVNPNALTGAQWGPAAPPAPAPPSDNGTGSAQLMQALMSLHTLINTAVTQDVPVPAASVQQQHQHQPVQQPEWAGSFGGQKPGSSFAPDGKVQFNNHHPAPAQPQPQPQQQRGYMPAEVQAQRQGSGGFSAFTFPSSGGSVGGPLGASDYRVPGSDYMASNLLLGMIRRHAAGGQGNGGHQ